MIPVVRNLVSSAVRTPQTKKLLSNSVNLLSKRFYAWSIERERKYY